MKLIDSLLLPGRDAACANDYIIPNSNARQDDRSAANPDIIANGHGSCLGSAKCKGTITSGFSKSICRVYRMKSGIDLNVGRNQRIITDRYFIVIQKGTVHIDFAVVSKKNIVAVVHKKGRRDP